jgi:hypothetical protein
MDHDAHLRLLGLLTARSHQLELVTAQIMARAIDVPESTGRLLVSATGIGAALGVLQVLVAQGEVGSLSRDAFGNWLRQARAANQARNRVIHSPWVVRDEEAEVPDAVLARGSMTLVDRTDDDLQRDVDVVAVAVVGGYELLRTS